MSSFVNELAKLLDDALQKEMIDKTSRDRLTELAQERESHRGVLSLATVLGWLGGLICGLGVVLLIAANWDDIHDAVKLLGFFVLFLGVHAGGIYLR